MVYSFLLLLFVVTNTGAEENEVLYEADQAKGKLDRDTEQFKKDELVKDAVSLMFLLLVACCLFSFSVLLSLWVEKSVLIFIYFLLLLLSFFCPPPSPSTATQCCVLERSI